MGSDTVGHHEPKCVFIFGCLLSLAALTVLSILFTRRTINFNARTTSVTRWLVLGVYFDSYIFVITSTTLRLGVGLNSPAICEVTILLCLLTYMSTKIIIYFFLVERVYIVRSTLPRKKDKLYLFNTFGVLIPFGTIVTLAFVYRIGSLDKLEQCKIGMGLPANIPLILFDSGVNIYLTSLFLSPLLGLYNFRQANPRLRRIAKRTFIGSLLTLSTSIANLIALATQVKHGGEYAWVCHLSCTGDIIFSAVVLHWITSSDVEGKTEAPAPSAAINPDECPVCKNHRPLFSLRRFRPGEHGRGASGASDMSTALTEKTATTATALGKDELIKEGVDEVQVHTNPGSPTFEVVDAGDPSPTHCYHGPGVTGAIAATRDLESALSTLKENPNEN